jgi:hypothetical protein
MIFYYYKNDAVRKSLVALLALTARVCTVESVATLSIKAAAVHATNGSNVPEKCTVQLRTQNDFCGEDVSLCSHD